MPAQSTPKTTAAVTGQATNGNRAILLMTVALVLAIELGGFYFLLKDSSIDFSTFLAPTHDRATSRKDPLFVSTPPVHANLQDDGGARHISLTLEIMTRDVDTANLLTEQMPLIRNAVVTMFGTHSLSYAASLEGKQQIRQEALERIRGVIDAEGGDGASVEGIYFSSLVIE